MFEPYTPPVKPHAELLSNWHWIDCDEATYRLIKKLRSLGLELPCSATSILPQNRRTPTVRSIRENLDGTTSVTYNTNRHRFGFCPFVTSSQRNKVFYDLNVFDKWLEDYVFPKCRIKAKRPCKPSLAPATMMAGA